MLWCSKCVILSLQRLIVKGLLCSFFLFVVTALSADFVLYDRLAVQLKFVTVVVVGCYFNLVHFATVEVVFVVLVVPSFELLLSFDLHLSVL